MENTWKNNLDNGVTEITNYQFTISNKIWIQH